MEVIDNSVPEVKTIPKTIISEKIKSLQAKFTANPKLHEIATEKFNYHFSKLKIFKNKYQKNSCGSNNITKESHPMMDNDTLIKIRLFEKMSENNVTYQKIEYVSSLNLLTISSKTCARNQNNVKAKTTKPKPTNKPTKQKRPPKQKTTRPPANLKRVLESLGNRGPSKSIDVPSKSIDRKPNMSTSEGDHTYSRVSNWISSHDFGVRDHHSKLDGEETVVSNDLPSDITSVTRTMRKKGEYDDVVVEERTDVVKCPECETAVSPDRDFSETVRRSVRTLSKFSQYSPFHGGMLKSASAPPTQFSVIVEGEESVRSLVMSVVVDAVLVSCLIGAVSCYEFCLFCPF